MRPPILSSTRFRPSPIRASTFATCLVALSSTSRTSRLTSAYRTDIQRDTETCTHKRQGQKPSHIAWRYKTVMCTRGRDLRHFYTCCSERRVAVSLTTLSSFVSISLCLALKDSSISRYRLVDASSSSISFLSRFAWVISPVFRSIFASECKNLDWILV